MIVVDRIIINSIVIDLLINCFLFGYIILFSFFFVFWKKVIGFKFFLFFCIFIFFFFIIIIYFFFKFVMLFYCLWD